MDGCDRLFSLQSFSHSLGGGRKALAHMIRQFHFSAFAFRPSNIGLFWWIRVDSFYIGCARQKNVSPSFQPFFRDVIKVDLDKSSSNRKEERRDKNEQLCRGNSSQTDPVGLQYSAPVALRTVSCLYQ